MKKEFQLRAAKEVIGYIKGKPSKIVVVEVQHNRYLEPKTADAWREMAAAAFADGLILHINSAWRSIEIQQSLWDRWEEKGGNRPARPGWSNHGQGTAVDINRAHDNGKTDKWLAENAGKFGFVMPMSYEPWHFQHEG